MNIKKKDILSISTLLISVFAIIISIRSCHISEQSLAITEQEYSDKFMTIWTFTYQSDNETFKIEPSNPDVDLQNAVVYYPDSISDYEWQIRLPENLLYITSPKSNLELKVKETISPLDSFTRVLDNASVPVLLESFYTLNGHNFHDISLYMLRYEAVIFESKYRNPDIKILGLTYVSRFDEELDRKEFLNTFWKTSVKHLRKIN